MKILNFGSLNLDFVYSVDHICVPGETISSTAMQIFCGGKGLNQSVALARAGAPVSHAGLVGEDGRMLVDICRENGVDTTHIRQIDGRCGNAMIQVAADGQNCIVLFGGANQRQRKEWIDEVFAGFAPGDFLLLQNEINHLDYLISEGAARGMRVVLNPSPFDAKVLACDLTKIDFFIVNEIEGGQITGRSDPEEILEAMRKRFPTARVVLTLGGDGAVYQDANERVRENAVKVDVVDTTAAGDTFLGYFLAGVMEGAPTAEILKRASRAAGIAVSRMGATPSIPRRDEVVQ